MSPAPGALAILTRPRGRNEAVAARLRAAGVPCAIFPVLRLDSLPAAMPAPQAGQMLVFVSRQAVASYFAGWRGPWPAGALAAGVGASTAAALARHVPPDAIAAPAPGATQDSEGLLAALDAAGIRPDRVVVLRAEQGREWLARAFEQRGVPVDRIAVYRRVPIPWTQAQCKQAGAARPCVLLLSSVESLDAIAGSFARHALPWPPLLHAVAVHPRIARRLQYVLEAAPPAARGVGMRPQVKICAPDDEAIFQAILAASCLRS